MDYPWSVGDVSRLCRHKLPEVRLWAVERLSLLYPEEAGDVALELLNDPDDVVALAAARHFSSRSEELFKDDLLVELLVQIDKYCGSWYTKEDFEEKEEKGELPYMVGEALDNLEDLGYGKAASKIETLFRKKKYDDIVEKICGDAFLLLEEKKRILGDEAIRTWQSGTGKPRQNFVVLVKLRDFFVDAPGAARGPIARAALSVFVRLVEYRELVGVNFQRINPLHAHTFKFSSRRSSSALATFLIVSSVALVIMCRAEAATPRL